MPLPASLYPLLRPLLFRLDAETAHEWTVKLMRMAHGMGMLKLKSQIRHLKLKCWACDSPNRWSRRGHGQVGIRGGRVVRAADSASWKSAP